MSVFSSLSTTSKSEETRYSDRSSKHSYTPTRNAGTTLTVAVDGKVSKQILDEEGEVLQMLNTFVHGMKVVLWEWSVKGDKTNEPGCLKKHLGELLSQFPHLKILTGDAEVGLPRSLVEAVFGKLFAFVGHGRSVKKGSNTV